MRVRAAITGVAVAALLAPAAHAAAPWSEPQTVSAAHEFVDPVAVAFSANGAGLASWTYQDGTDAHATTGADAATRPAGASAFAAQHRLVAPRRTDRATVLVGVAAFGAGRTLRATVERRRLDPLRPDAFQLRAGGRLVATGPQMLRATLAADATGDAALAWWERARQSRLFVAVRRRGRPFAAPRRVAGHGFGDVAVAVGPRGDVLVAWESDGVIRTRTRSPHGARFGATTVVTRSGARGADLAAGLSRRGRAVVAWGAQRRSSGGETGRITYAAAIRRPGGTQFAVTVLEHRPASLLAQPVALAVEPSGRATFAWTAGRVRVVTAAPGAPFGGPQDVSGPDAVLGDVAASGGRRALTWVVGTADDGSGRIEAAYAGAGATRFGPPEVVTAGPQARVPRVAFDPATGRPTVVWSERPLTTPGVPKTVARAATRTTG
jgi:hypothetical protein